MTRPAEFMVVDDVAHSWYCTVCGQELGVDLDELDGMPADGCPAHGTHRLAWETWNVETDPTYPHRVVRGTHLTPYVDPDPDEWCPEHECWWESCEEQHW